MTVYTVWDLPGVTEAMIKEAWRTVGVDFPDPMFFPVRHLER